MAKAVLNVAFTPNCSREEANSLERFLFRAGMRYSLRWQKANGHIERTARSEFSGRSG
jgi:hypothetical protein